MEDAILNQEPAIRLGVFLGVLGVMALWEVAAPQRRRDIPRVLRWSNNLALVVVDTVFLRLAFPVLAVGVAVAAGDAGWGLFNALDWPLWLEVLLAFAILDLTIYLQHVLFHAVPALWRLHRMHHADLEVDTTTGLRFHPLEILASMAIKLAVVGAIGAPAVVVIVFEVVLNASALFNHANVRLPKRLDALLRLVIVTPDMHRVHHSIIPAETNSNFGFNLPWWDRLFGTYLAQPREGHHGMTIGIEQFRTRRDLWIDAMLVQPFRGRAQDYSINRGDGDGKAKPARSQPPDPPQ